MDSKINDGPIEPVKHVKLAKPRKKKEQPRPDYTINDGMFRQTSIGLALIDTLDDMILSGRMTPQLANKVLNNFDKAFKERIKDPNLNHRNFKVKGHLSTYQCLEGNWNLRIKDAMFKVEGGEESTMPGVKLKVLAYASESGDSSLVRKKKDEE